MAKCEISHASLRFCSWNIGSVKKHWQRVVALCDRESIDVIALQEVYADATTQRQVSKRLRERGWFVFWGGVAAAHSGDHSKSDVPGVAVMVRDHLVAREVNLDDLPELRPWLLKGRLMGLVVEGRVLFNVYAQSGHGSAYFASQRRLINESLFLCASHYAHQPVVAVGDWNQCPTDTTYAFHMTLAGGGVQAGSLDEDGQFLPTFVSGEISSVLDGFVLNKFAAPLCVGSSTVTAEALQHRPVCLDVQANVYIPSKSCLKARKCLGSGRVPDNVSYLHWQRCQDKFLAACRDHDVENAWLIWSSCFEDILFEVAVEQETCQLLPNDNNCRRGVVAPTRVSPEFSSSSHPLRKELVLSERRLYKAQCQLRQLARGHLAPQAAAITAVKALRTIKTLAPDLPCPYGCDLLDPQVASAFLGVVEKFCSKQHEADKSARIAAWKQRMRTDWSVDPGRVYKWIRGDNLEQVHAVLENGVLRRGASAIFAALRRFWVPVYSLPAHLVARDVAQHSGHLCVDPALTFCGAQVDPELLLHFACRLKATSAPGPDGWEAHNWKRMDLRTAGFLSLFLECCAEAEKWPQILASAHTVCIPKDGRRGLQEVSKLRPISVACLAYRAWAWVVLQKAKPFMQELVHDRQYGGVPGRTCAHMYLQMQLELERVLVGAVPEPDEPPLRPHGYTEDSWKFFDTLQPPACRPTNA